MSIELCWCACLCAHGFPHREFVFSCVCCSVCKIYYIFVCRYGMATEAAQLLSAVLKDLAHKGGDTVTDVVATILADGQLPAGDSCVTQC